MELFDIPVFDDDFYKMIFRFALNIVALTIIIRLLYYRTAGKQSYVFTYYMIGIIVFLICFTLKKFELNLGMALGLFAIFGILQDPAFPLDGGKVTTPSTDLRVFISDINVFSTIFEE